MHRLFHIVCLALPLALFGLEVEVEAPSALLMNAKTGAILFERDAEAPYYPASITKIATALYLLENKEDALHELAVASADAVASISPETKVKRRYRCPSHWLEFDGSHIGLKKGEVMSLKDLLYGLMLASGNDAANVIAEHVAGSVPDFVEGLNARLRELGCRNTYFTNPHGLHHPDHVTTARDMACIAREALNYQTFREVVSTVVAPRPQTNMQEATDFRQTNRLIRQGAYRYSRAYGIKTGYTSHAGSTLVAAAEDENRSLIAVVLGAQSSGERFSDAIRLFEAGFNEQRVVRHLLPAGGQSYSRRVQGGRRKLTTRLADSLLLAFYPSEEPETRAVVVWSQNLTPPIDEGAVVGEIRVVNQNGEVVADAPLLAAREVPASLRHALGQTWASSAPLRKGAKTGLLACLGVGLVLLLRKRSV